MLTTLPRFTDACSCPMGCGFAGLALPSYDRSFHASFTLRGSWSGIGRIAVRMARQGSDLQLTRAYRITSPVEPGCHESAAVVVAEVWPVVLERTVPNGNIDPRRDLDVVLLFGQVTLQVVDNLPALGDVEDTPLTDQHVGDDRVVDVTLVLRLPRIVHAEEEVVGIEERSLRAVRQRVELPEVAARDEGAVFALVELRADADVLQILEDELGVVGEEGRPIRREAQTGGKAVRMPRRGEEPPGLGRVVPEIFRGLAHLVDRQSPVREARRHGGVEGAGAFKRGFDHPLSVDPQRDRLPDAHVLERELVRTHRDVGLNVAGKLSRAEIRPLLLERLLDLHPVRPVDAAGELPSQIVLAG